MAISYRKYKKKITATVRLNGECLSLTFPSKSEAEQWSRRVDIAIRASLSNPDRPFNRQDFLPKKAISKKEMLLKEQEKQNSNIPNVEWTLKKALQHFTYTKLESYKSYEETLNRIKKWQKSPIAEIKLKDLSPEILYAYVHEQIDAGKAPQTIKNNIFIISALFRVATSAKTRGGWNLLSLDNPVKHIELPKSRPNRQRRLKIGEEQALFDALAECSHPEIVPFVRFALETGMRKSEILGITKAEINQTPNGYEIIKQDTKNGERRIIFLSSRAVDAIKHLIEKLKDKPFNTKLFKITDNQIEINFTKARNKINSNDLRLHDLRHEAISRLADKNLSIGDLSNQSGHRSMQTLLRYVNVSERNIREKLEQL